MHTWALNKQTLLTTALVIRPEKHCAKQLMRTISKLICFSLEGNKMYLNSDKVKVLYLQAGIISIQ